MIPEHLPILCLAVRDLYKGRGNLYVSNLYGMLSRYMPVPFTLHCFTDRPRSLPPEVQQHDCSAWTNLGEGGARPTKKKLILFNPDLVPFSEFIYLDLSLVIQKDMTQLLSYAFERPEELVIIDDWFYPCYNSAVMRIRQGALRVVYDAAAAGEEIPQISIGDQGFITACIADRGLQDQVALFPETMISSYKVARELNRTDPKAARRMVDEATIIKFHGKPKPHHVLDPFYNFFSIRLKNGPRDASFWKRELRQHWRKD